jgi:hypothetical protein
MRPLTSESKGIRYRPLTTAPSSPISRHQPLQPLLAQVDQGHNQSEADYREPEAKEPQPHEGVAAAVSAIENGEDDAEGAEQGERELRGIRREDSRSVAQLTEGSSAPE